MIRALATHASLSNDRLFADTLAPNVAGALEYVLKASAKTRVPEARAVLVHASRFFNVADDQRAATQCRERWSKSGSPWPIPALPLPELPAVSLGGALVPDDPLRLASAVIGSVERVVRLADDDAVDIVPGFLDAWRGAKLDVRNVVTPSGALSFSFRWHGARPAVLWDVEAPTGVELRLRCSAVDTTWAASGSRGEALLNISPLVASA